MESFFSTLKHELRPNDDGVSLNSPKHLIGHLAYENGGYYCSASSPLSGALASLKFVNPSARLSPETAGAVMAGTGSVTLSFTRMTTASGAMELERGPR